MDGRNNPQESDHHEGQNRAGVENETAEDFRAIPGPSRQPEEPIIEHRLLPPLPGTNRQLLLTREIRYKTVPKGLINMRCRLNLTQKGLAKSLVVLSNLDYLDIKAVISKFEDNYDDIPEENVYIFYRVFAAWVEAIADYEKNVMPYHASLGSEFGRFWNTLSPAQLISYSTSINTFITSVDRVVNHANQAIVQYNRAQIALAISKWILHSKLRLCKELMFPNRNPTTQEVERMRSILFPPNAQGSDKIPLEKIYITVPRIGESIDASSPVFQVNLSGRAPMARVSYDPRPVLRANLPRTFQRYPVGGHPARPVMQTNLPGTFPRYPATEYLARLAMQANLPGTVPRYAVSGHPPGLVPQANLLGNVPSGHPPRPVMQVPLPLPRHVLGGHPSRPVILTNVPVNFPRYVLSGQPPRPALLANLPGTVPRYPASGHPSGPVLQANLPGSVPRSAATGCTSGPVFQPNLPGTSSSTYVLGRQSVIQGPRYQPLIYQPPRVQPPRYQHLRVQPIRYQHPRVQPLRYQPPAAPDSTQPTHEAPKQPCAIQEASSSSIPLETYPEPSTSSRRNQPELWDHFKSMYSNIREDEWASIVRTTAEKYPELLASSRKVGRPRRNAIKSFVPYPPSNPSKVKKSQTNVPSTSYVTNIPPEDNTRQDNQGVHKNIPSTSFATTNPPEDNARQDNQNTPKYEMRKYTRRSYVPEPIAGPSRAVEYPDYISPAKKPKLDIDVEKSAKVTDQAQKPRLVVQPFTKISNETVVRQKCVEAAVEQGTEVLPSDEYSTLDEILSDLQPEMALQESSSSSSIPELEPIPGTSYETSWETVKNLQQSGIRDFESNIPTYNAESSGSETDDAWEIAED